ncbi:trimeric intracellular cation channel family protein [Rhizorhabdus sp.]|uniref:trimeric intracellular cation channel family protein n=1 Tax=Rhizorhabdus sp. TaxID=1968843 RepID=UPI001B49AF4A|nr:trimeric intracellular cation channel family protein [Rhizorhabdus sp.]MBP8233802.1 trimeric intracellular cation channel family protein [Rhizorhabdus sp.]
MDMPELLMVRSALPMLDIFGIAIFAVSGALAAARRGQTIVTFTFFAAVTGTGGGTLRDLLIGAPVFWIHDNRALAVCLLAALAVWMTPTRIWPVRALEWFDGVGLAAYAVFGSWKALAYGIPPLGAATMGVVTACMGGIVRDVLAGEPSILLRPELYVTAAALAAGLFVVLTLLGAPLYIAAALGAGAGFALRALAIVRGISLPGYRD